VSIVRNELAEDQEVKVAATPGVECPGRGGLTFRAWFVETEAGWRFPAFVE